jgi:hypothetical protein
MVFPLRGFVYWTKEGVTTYAPDRHWYALKERFRHAQRGRASSNCLSMKLPVSSGQQPKPQISFILLHFSQDRLN